MEGGWYIEKTEILHIPVFNYQLSHSKEHGLFELSHIWIATIRLQIGYKTYSHMTFKVAFYMLVMTPGEIKISDTQEAYSLTPVSLVCKACQPLPQSPKREPGNNPTIPPLLCHRCLHRRKRLVLEAEVLTRLSTLLSIHML